MTDHIQTLSNIHHRLTAIAQLMATGDATDDLLLLIAKHSHCVHWKEDGRMLVGYHLDIFRELSEEET